MDELFLNVIFNKLSFERGFGSSVWKRIIRNKISLKKKELIDAVTKCAVEMTPCVTKQITKTLLMDTLN